MLRLSRLAAAAFVLFRSAQAYTALDANAVQRVIDASGRIDTPSHRAAHQVHDAHASHRAVDEDAGDVESFAPAPESAPQPNRSSAPEALIQEAPTTTPEATGMTTNGVGDFMAFVAALLTNIGMVVFCVAFFMCARPRYPLVYDGNVTAGYAPKTPGPGWGWYKAAVGTTTAEVEESVGLDHAMLLEFTIFAKRLLLILSIPLLCILGPMHWTFGGNGAGEDHLSYLSFGNVKTCGVDEKTGARIFPDFGGCWLYYVHAFIVWGVVFCVQVSIYQAMERFMPRRYKWLKQLPEPRATTLLVEGIPDDIQTDGKLKQYFGDLFGATKIKSAYVAKYSVDVETAKKNLDAANCSLRKAQAQREHVDTQNVSAVSAIEECIKKFSNEVQLEETNLKAAQKQFKAASATPGGVNCSNGFVTFNNQSDTQIALNLLYDSDADVMTMSIAPEPDSLIWKDLQQDQTANAMRTVLGCGMVVGLAFLYLPIVIGTTNLAKAIDMGALQPIWAGLAPTMGLQLMVAFLPTFLIIIFRLCFTLTADAWAQKMLQEAYFVFQLVFVVLAAAVGTNFREFTKTLATQPFAAFGVLADSMPTATHFYMNFMVLQWVTHFMNLTRYVPLGKFMLFNKLYDDSDAKEMAEPEDQDYYGMGSRSARFTINLCIGIIYGTLSPPMNLLTWVNFYACRVVYGYLMPFAETKKDDLGGAFFVSQLQHVFVGNIIYCILMIGVLMRRAPDYGPVIIAAPALVYVIWSMRRFSSRFRWRALPFPEIKDVTKGKTTVGAYVQPEYQCS